MNYYNEFDKYPAQWLRNLSDDGEIPKGTVDERSITEIKPSELDGYAQCHFFAGLGGWPYALRLAGWPPEREVWTGSCPCQPFSTAGKRKGMADERHLWPAFRWLITQRRPPVIFGEQVASKDGRLWLAGVRSDLETLGYEVGAADLCAAGVGAPHIRQRLFWVANSKCGAAERHGYEVAGATSQNQGREKERERLRHDTGNGGEHSGLGNSSIIRRDEQRNTQKNEAEKGLQQGPEQPGKLYRGVEGSPWGDFTLIPCADGKARRVKPGIMPLAHGIPARVGSIKAYGNSIVPQVAAEFIKSFISILPRQHLQEP